MRIYGAGEFDERWFDLQTNLYTRGLVKVAGNKPMILARDWTGQEAQQKSAKGANQEGGS